MSLFTLPCVILDFVLSFLTKDELLTLRLVCAHAKEIASNEIRRRLKCQTMLLRCCTSIDKLNAQLTLYGCNHTNVLYQQSYFHSKCDYGYPLLYPYNGNNVMEFEKTQTLTLRTKAYSPPTTMNIAGFSEKFSNITRLYLLGVNITTYSLTVALSTRWTKLHTISFKYCIGFTPLWLLALNENITSLTVNKCCYSNLSGKNRKKKFRSISALQLNKILPSMEYLSIDLLDDYKCYNLNVFEMISSSSSIREVRVNIDSEQSTTQYLNNPNLEYLRLHIRSSQEQNFGFTAVHCKFLKTLELKFFYNHSSSLTTKLMKIFGNSVESLTMTTSYFVCDDYVFNTIHDSFRKLQQFFVRKYFPPHCGWNDCQPHTLLRYLEHQCRAKHVFLYFRRSKFRLLDMFSMLDFLYEIIRLAACKVSIENGNTYYSLIFTQNIGLMVLPRNVECTIVQKHITINEMWKMAMTNCN